MKKYSIVINHIQNDMYALVINTWFQNGDERMNETNDIKTNLTFDECLNLISELKNNI